MASSSSDQNDHTAFCTVYNLLSAPEQAEVKSFIGENCDREFDESGLVDDASNMEKRKPNFMRFGRSPSNAMQFGKKGSSDPNFLRFGKSVEPSFLRFGKKIQQNFLRFGRSDAPNFLRFGKSAAKDDGAVDDDQFDRENRKPNFLRFG